jgi:hypothetical protein
MRTNRLMAAATIFAVLGGASFGAFANDTKHLPRTVELNRNALYDTRSALPGGAMDSGSLPGIALNGRAGSVNLRGNDSGERGAGSANKSIGAYKPDATDALTRFYGSKSLYAGN